MSEPARFAEIDALKAAGIVTVIFIHSIRSDFDPTASDVEIWLGHATRFAVPAFLFASGFLYSTREPVPGSRTLARFRRVLVPYLIASLLAQVWPQPAGMPDPSRGVLVDLFCGSSFGPYYYVFVIAGLVLVTPIVARLPRAALVTLTAGFVAAQWLADVANRPALPLYWQIRSPLLWWGYFLVGWTLREHWGALAAGIAARRGAIVTALAASSVALLAVTTLTDERLVVRTAAWANVYAVIGLLLAASVGRSLPPVVRFLSDATYPIYLFHLFFLYAAATLFAPPTGRADPLAIGVPFAAALAGSVALVALSQRILGARSRGLIGA